MLLLLLQLWMSSCSELAMYTAFSGTVVELRSSCQNMCETIVSNVHRFIGLLFTYCTALLELL